MRLPATFSNRISLHFSLGNPKRWSGFHAKGDMQLVESTIVGPGLGIASTFTFYSHTFVVPNLRGIYALSMELSIQLAKMPVLPWAFWRMMESGISASKKHAKLKSAPQLDTSLQSFWPTTHQHTPEHYGMSSNIKCVMIFSDGSNTLLTRTLMMMKSLTMDFTSSSTI